ncbi:BEACH domain-containing protein [Entamoeba marina]
MKLNDDRMKAFGLIQRKLRSLQGEQDKKVAQNSSVWSDIVGPLFDELGVWSEADSNVENTHNKWKLDQTEGPARMRKRMVRDDLFYQQYNIDPSNCDMVKIQVEKQSPEGNDNEVTNHPPPKLSRIQSFSNKSTKFNVVDNSVNLEEDTIHSLLEDGDQIISAFNCGVLKGIDKENGVFVIGKTHFYIVKGYCMEGNEFVLKGDVSSNTIPIKNIQIVKPRRYMLRSIAVELFSRTGQNELLIFEQHFTEAYKNITKTISSNTHDVLLDIAGIVDTNKRPKLLKLFSSDESAMQQQWVEGKISNFMYLMFLNTQAGRTFNDLTQYPVMPWVLSDYTSTTLDLTNESVYRDLSKPMGAITEERAENVKTRYEMVKDSPETAFHYGSHYSSIGVALYYLVRIEPYAHNAIKMQGTTFDLPDRLFHSIADVWNMLTTRSVTIVYELIPEFFFFPEFLLNLNHYDYGIRDSGVRVEDVVLPPWANGSPQRFVNTQMMALESPYVSSHLHEWIDLIFGYKQRGKAAEDSLNLFHPSSYEGGIDMDDVPAHLRGAYEAMIINFGQTPKQLFKTPHPQRQSTTTITTKTLFSCSDNDVIILTLDSLEFPPNYHINVTWGTVLKLQGKVNATMEDDHIGIITCCSISEDGKILATGGEDCVIAIYSIHRTVEYQKSIVGHSTPLCCICLCRSYSILVSASNDGVVAIWDLNTLNVIRSFIHDRILGVVVHEKLGHILTYSKSKCIVRSINATILNEINNTDEQDSDINISIFGSGLQWYTSYVIITGHVNGDVKLWDCSELICCGDGLCSTHSHKPKLIKNLKKYNKIVTALALTETHDKLAVGYADGEVIEYQLRDETKMNY